MKKLFVLILIPFLSIACGKSHDGEKLTEVTSMEQLEGQYKIGSYSGGNKDYSSMLKFAESAGLVGFITIKNGNVVTVLINEHTSEYKKIERNLYTSNVTYLSCKSKREASFVDTSESENEEFSAKKSASGNLYLDIGPKKMSLIALSDSEKVTLTNALSKYKRKCETEAEARE